MAEETQTPEQQDPQAELRKALDAFNAEAANMLEQVKQHKAEVEAAKNQILTDKAELAKAKDKANEDAQKIGQLHASLYTKPEGQEKALVDAVQEGVESIKQAKSRVDQLERSVTEYVEALLGKTGPDGKPLPGVKADLEEKAKQLNDLHSSIFQSSDPNQKPLSDQVGIFLDEFSKKKREMDGIKEEVESYQIELLGKLVEGQRAGGVKGRVEKIVKDLGDLLSNSTDTQERLRKQSEKMLYGASTASLGKSSAEQKASFDLMNKVWLGMIGLAIVVLMVTPFIDFTSVLAAKSISADLPSDSSGASQSRKDIEWWIHWLMRLPFIGGAIWLGWYASRERSRNFRLQQEYAYKENVAKIYYALKEELTEMENANESTQFARALKVRIMRILASSVAYNPSETLDSKSHDGNGPALEFFEKGIDAAKDLVSKVKLPGS
jgi:hypothetical protein